MLNKQMLAKVLAEKAKTGEISSKGTTQGKIALPSMSTIPSVHLNKPKVLHTSMSISQPKFKTLKLAVGGMVPSQQPMMQDSAPGQQPPMPGMVQLLQRKPNGSR